jgi:hypothetical protein
MATISDPNPDISDNSYVPLLWSAPKSAGRVIEPGPARNSVNLELEPVAVRVMRGRYELVGFARRNATAM